MHRRIGLVSLLATVSSTFVLSNAAAAPSGGHVVRNPCQSNAPNRSNSGATTHIYVSDCNNEVTNEATGTVTGTPGTADTDAPVLVTDPDAGINVFKNKGTIGEGDISKSFVNKGKIGKYLNEGTITSNTNNNLNNTVGVQNYLFIDTFENTGLIQSGAGNFNHAIENIGATVLIVDNYGSIIGSSVGNGNIGILNTDHAYIQTFTNYDQIVGSVGSGSNNTAISNVNYSRIDTFDNYGSLIAGSGTSNTAIKNDVYSRIDYFNNYGLVSTGDGSQNVAIFNSQNSQITNFANNGTVQTGAGNFNHAVENTGSTILVVDNQGSIIGSPGGSANIGVVNVDNAYIQTFSNHGEIIGSTGLGTDNVAISNANYSRIDTFDNHGSLIAGSGSFNTAVKNEAYSRIEYFNNYGAISTGDGTSNTAINNSQNSQITYFTNYGSVQSGSGNFSHAIDNVGATILNVSNFGNITGGTGGSANIGIDNKNGSYIQTFNNHGNIVGSTGSGTNNAAILNYGYSRIDTFNNYNLVAAGYGASNSAFSNELYSRVEYFNNYGTVATGPGTGNIAIYNSTNSQITYLNNYGSMSVGSGDVSHVIRNDGYMKQVYNFGKMYTGTGIDSYSILNNGAIQVFANGQQFGIGNERLTFTGNVPIFYQIVITDTGYGQTAFVNSTGSTQFGVYEGSHAKAKVTYQNVVTGLTASNLGQSAGTISFKGKFKGQTWTMSLTPGATNIWDLSFSLDWINTYNAMLSNRDAVRGALQQRYAVLSTVLDYDCEQFDKYGVCLSFQARNTGFGSQSTGAGVLTAAYRVTDKFRVGAFLDYQAWQNTPFGVTYWSGGLQNGYDNATFGGFVGYADNADGTGLKARVSGAYNPGKVTITRALLENTEAGSGSAGLYGSGVYGEVGWGFSLGNSAIITPYAGIRYIDTTRNAYGESYNSAVQFPIAYNAFYERVVTGTAGAIAQGKLIDRLGYRIGGGIEVDMSRAASGYSGSSTIPDLEVFSLAHGGVWNTVRPAGLVGLTFDIAPNQKFLATTIVREQPFSTRAYLSGLMGYQVAF